MVNANILANNILGRLMHYVARITANTLAAGGSLSKNRNIVH